jgi:phenylalanyl-tRNA synthetase beta chain
VEGLIGSISKDAQVDFVPADLIWAQTGAEILLNSQTVGTAGVVSQAVSDKLDFKDMSPCAVELDFEMLMSLAGGAIKVKPIPRFPAIQRDLSIIVDEEIRWADIIKAVESKACGELEDVKFVGIYRGKGIPPGRKSVTLTLRFRDEDGTLTHETVDGFEGDIVKSLTESTKAEMRTV